VLRNHVVEGLLKYELTGLLGDFFLINSVFIVIFLIQSILKKSFRKLFNVILTSLIVILCLFHVMILSYYVYSLKPLDQFLFTYSLKEILFTVTTSNANFLSVGVLVILFVLIAIFFPGLFNRIKFRERIFRWFFMVILISVPLSFLSLKMIDKDNNDIRRNIKINKSLFFYRKSCSYLLRYERDMKLSPENLQKFRGMFSNKDFISEEYPLLHQRNNTDNLGYFFIPSDTLPNFVILITEGLGERFLQSFHGIQLMPFLDSLTEHSLHWDRFLTTGERSFAVVPSITGSLPYGETGFMLLDQLPRHITMINLLKRLGYQSHFFYGQGAWFHQKDRFFRMNDIDLIIDKSDFSSGYDKVMALENKFFWGYNDMDLFQQSIEILDTLPPGPRIDLYFTGSMHSPFPVDNINMYNTRLDSLIKISGLSRIDQKYIGKYRHYLASVMFFDDALKYFMKEHEKREDFKNTIFLITGDHPMTEIPIENSIKRYHVPLIIFSPMLRKPKKIHATGSHLDIYPTIMAFLKNNYNLPVPSTCIDLGDCLDTIKEFRNLYPIPLMNDNREIIDYLENGYFLSQGNRAYQVDPDLDLIDIENSNRLSDLQKNLDAFRRVNWFVCMNKRLIPDSIYFRDLCYIRVSAEHKEVINISESDEFINICPQIVIPNAKELFYDFSYYLDYYLLAIIQVG